MIYVYSYLQSATTAIEHYTGEVPFAIHLKAFFKLNTKFGGRDRKMITHFCYCYFRTGNLFKKEGILAKLKKSIFLCSNLPSTVLEAIDTTYNELAAATLQEKLAFLEVSNGATIFPLYKHVSEAIDNNAFLANQLQQPYLYIRIRPKHLANVLLRLQKLPIAYTIFDPYTIQLPNGFKVEEHFEIDKEVVIQDFSSQQVFNQLLTQLPAKQHYKIWDCCAASGGKTILFNDLYNGTLNIFVTDVRESILQNLQKRLFTARIMNYKSAQHNLAKQPLLTEDKFDIIICDVPCSGSGTWSRTPEQVVYFKEKQLVEFTTLQLAIATNAAKSLRQGGYFIYITCSVFAMENEQVVNKLSTASKLTIVNQYYIPGYTNAADTMFVSILR